jgi:glutamate-1-semialdehyde 2,1-aminomutase
MSTQTLRDRLDLNDLDRRIWQEELEEWVPMRVFDQHTHIYRWAHNLDLDKDVSAYGNLVKNGFEEASSALLDECDATLMPGRETHRLAFPFPYPQCDFAAANDYIAAQTALDPNSAALMLVHPTMSASQVEATVLQHGFLGFKPYRNYSMTGDINECRITDFLPEHQIAVADRYGLMVMMHISKRRGMADEENQRDLLDLCERYPRVRWILAHCARSYSAWPIEQAASTLRRLPNLWFDTSSVCESDAFDALFSIVGIERVLYGSDDVPVGATRGKYLAWGYGWAYLSPHNQSLNTSHCDGRFTFVRYEQLRAMRRAAWRYGASKQQIENLFSRCGENLVQEVRDELKSKSGEA